MGLDKVKSAVVAQHDQVDRVATILVRQQVGMESLVSGAFPVALGVEVFVGKFDRLVILTKGGMDTFDDLFAP
ncbi:hypothetical protein [Desulfofustis glycolicus]|uniref:hypothetical protein n=1 Tax=Desulfofustis glycolicus TaxID=51195 RepID=UPI0009FD9B30|nr:hypothetical protein [Desulfofustis glycolicus]MCB2214770.1 hypothetical protein [Desulfobulbaceae bacterium]